jgi:hypothetical protein
VSAPPFSTAILGNDAFLAASPALPVQLMHAALAAGFDAVVPASLGDELVAGETLRLAQLRGRRPVVQCACPFALAQLCKREANLSDLTLAVAPAVVALARALRSEQPTDLHITYIGACPAGQDPAIDLQIAPDAFLRGLLQKGILLHEQPDVFSDRLPPDRRRFLSRPGGAPRSDVVGAVLRRDLVALRTNMNPLLAVADALFDGGPTMIDPAGTYRCACAGGDDTRSVDAGRVAIEQLEPARAGTPIFEAPAWLDLRPTELPPSEPDGPSSTGGTALASFADAARIASSRDAADAPSAATAAQSSEAARRMYALGVRTARRRGVAAPPLGSADPVMLEHVPPTSPTLRAPSIDRELPVPRASGMGDVSGRTGRANEARTSDTPLVDPMPREIPDHGAAGQDAAAAWFAAPPAASPTFVPPLFRRAPTLDDLLRRD